MKDSTKKSQQPMRLSIAYFTSDKHYEDLAARNFHALKTDSNIEHIFAYSPLDLDDSFIEAHKNIMKYPHGYGLWCWKPYIILKALGELNQGDYLLYVDADQKLPANVTNVIRHLHILKQDIASALRYGKAYEYLYSKRDLLVELGCDTHKYTHSVQIEASKIIIRKTPFVEDFIKEWHYYCENKWLIAERPKRLENYPDFKWHKHDQSIFSLLYKKNGLTPIKGQSHFWKYSYLATPHNIPPPAFSNTPRNLQFNSERLLKPYESADFEIPPCKGNADFQIPLCALGSGGRVTS